MKGQIETMGLVIIVVLLIVIGLVVMIFTLRYDSEESNFLTVKANSMMNALDKADLDGGRFREIMGSCCAGVEEDCDGIKLFFNGLVANIDENVSLSVSDNYFSGRECETFVSSTAFSYGVGCSASVRVCK